MINNSTTPNDNSIDETTNHSNMLNTSHITSSSFSPLSNITEQQQPSIAERITPFKKLKTKSPTAITATLPRRSPRLKQVVKRESIAISELELSNDISDYNNDNSHSDMMSEMSMEISSPVGMISYRYGRNNSSALQRGGNKNSENASKPFRRDTIDKTELNALLDSIDHEDDHHHHVNTDDNHSCSMGSDASMDTLQLAQNVYLMLGDDDNLLPSTQRDDDDNDASINQEKSVLHNLSDISNPTVLSSIPSSNPSSLDKNRKKKRSSKKSRKSFETSSRVDNSTDYQDVSGISSINLSSNISTDSVALIYDSNRSSANDNHNDDRMSICGSEDTMNSRRLTVDPNDLNDLVDDLNSDSHEGGYDRGQKNYDDDDYCNVDHMNNNNNRSDDGNDSSRDSIDTVLLMKQVADTLEELDRSNDDDHVLAMNSLHHNYRRRETIDSTDIAMLNEELNDYHDCDDVVVVDVEKKRGIGKIYNNDHKDYDGPDCNDDGSIDNDTVNPGDLLNDSLSTYNSMGESILTMDLIEHVQAAIDKDHDDDVSDAESDLTSMSLLPLADMLALKNELAADNDNDDNRASSSSNLEDMSHINGTSVSKKHPLHTHDLNMNQHNSAVGLLKSCMSSKKKPRRTNGIHSSFRIDQDDDDDHHHGGGGRDTHKDMLQSSVRKTVVFGSPQAAEFNKLSPTTNYTPLDRKKTRVLYSMSATKESDDADGGIDPITIDNDRILESWDRLTNVSDSDMIDAVVVALDGGCDGDDEISLYSSCVDTNISVKRRRQSKLQPILDISPLDSNNGDGSDEVVMDSMTESIDRLESMNQSVDGYLDGYQTGDVTETVNLPHSLAELLHQNQAAVNEAIKVKEVVVQSDRIETTTVAASNDLIDDASRNVSMCSNSKTEEIEMDLHTLMMNISSYNMHQQVLNNNSNYISHSSSSTSIDPLSSDADTSNISLVGPHYHERSTDRSNDSMRSHDSSSDALGFLIGRISELEKSNNVDGTNKNDTNLNASSVDDSSIQPPTRCDIDHHNTSTDEITYNLEGSLQALINNIASSPLSSERHDKSRIEEMSAILKTHDHDEGLYNNLANDQMDFSVLVSPSHHRDHDTSDPYTSGSSYDYDGINTSNLDSGRSYSIDTLISTDTFRDMMMDNGVDVEEVDDDEDDDDDQDVAADLKNNCQTAQLMGRLKALNSDSRSNALLHCSTPSVMLADHGPTATATTSAVVVAKSRLSIGLKRKSILNESVNHVGSIIADAHNNKRGLGNITSTTRKQRRFSIQASSTVVLNDEEDEDDCGGHKDEDEDDQLIALKPLESLTSSSSSSSSISNFSTALQAEFVDKLTMKLSYFFSAIQSIKTIISNYRLEVQNIVQKTMSDNYHSIYNSTILSKVSIETLLLAWEMKSTDSDVFLQTAMNSIGAINEEDQVLMLNDKDHSDTEQMWLNVTSVNLIAQTSALKSQSRDQSTTGRFLTKALNLTNNVPSNHYSSQLVAMNDKCNIRNMLTEEMHQSEKMLRELTLMVDIINKTTYCSVETFKSSCIKLLVYLSSNIYISLIFHLSKEIDDQQSSPTTTTKLLVESIAVDLIMSKAVVDKKERAFVSSFFANNICNVQMNGPLCAENLEQLEQPSDICSLLYKVLTH